MKKRTFTLLGLLLISVCAFAQTPEWIWVENAGGSSYEEGLSISTDAYGNIYLTGRFNNAASFGSHSLISSGGQDIFAAKMDANRNWLWATQAGGVDFDCGNSIKTNDAGNSYVTGRFGGIATFGSFSLTSSGDDDIFVAKLDANGNWLWATKAGGIENDHGYSITIDDVGNCYLTGLFYGTATFGSYSLTSCGSCDIVVAKIDTNGNWLWATRAGGNDLDIGSGITIDTAGNSYITGSFMGIATFGSNSLISSGSYDIFVAKLDANGNWLWVTRAGGNDLDGGNGIAIDTAGNSYVSGSFCDVATFGSYSLISSGLFEIFVAKMDANGNWLWATQAGGNDWDFGGSITIDDAGNSYVTGNFYETAIFGPYSITSSGWSDIFVAKTDANGNWLWAVQAGGNDEDYGSGIIIDTADNSYVTGSFIGMATFGSYLLTSNGDEDIFVAKLGNETSFENEIIPTEIRLSNYPNPFNPNTTISYSLKENTKVSLKIYNIKGQLIETLFNEYKNKGNHSVNWDAKNSSSGIYFYKLKAGNYQKVKKMVLLR